jgi:hypothetical protein
MPALETADPVLTHSRSHQRAVSARRCISAR